MGNIPPTIVYELYRFLDGTTPIPVFEQWIYTTPELEQIFSVVDYLTLISLNFEHSSNQRALIKLIESQIDYGDYGTWKLRTYLHAVKNLEPTMVNAIVGFYDLYCTGCSFLHKLGLVYGLTIVVPPSFYGVDEWKELTAVAQEAILATFFPQILADVEDVLRWLDEGMIIIKQADKRDAPWGYIYVDYRDPKDQ